MQSDLSCKECNHLSTKKNILGKLHLCFLKAHKSNKNCEVQFREKNRWFSRPGMGKTETQSNKGMPHMYS